MNKGVILILGEEFELEQIGVDAYYGSAESDNLEIMAQILEEVEAQGLETNISKGLDKKYRIEFVRKS